MRSELGHRYSEKEIIPNNELVTHKMKSGGYIEGLSRQIPILLLLGSIVICEYFNNFILPILQLVSPLHLILNLFNQFLLVEVLNRVYIKR